MKEIRTIKGQLAELYTTIRGDEDTEVDTKTATCLIQISQAQLKAIETQRKEKQAEQFERRLEELEKKLEEKTKGGGAWDGTAYSA
jgi:CRISPR/Cas system CSM-associated protein Csm2 small subunit